MSQCKAQAEDASSLWRCLVEVGHVGEHRFDTQYYRNELARLQARVEEAEGGAKMLREELDSAVKREKTALRERDRYKARYKLRVEELTRLAWRARLLQEHGYSDTVRQHDLEVAVAESDAALNATLQEAREKEGQK